MSPAREAAPMTISTGVASHQGMSPIIHPAITRTSASINAAAVNLTGSGSLCGFTEEACRFQLSFDVEDDRECGGGEDEADHAGDDAPE